MLTDKPVPPPVHEFMIDAQIMLTQSQECLHHLELIGNDRDASNSMVNALGTLAERAQARSLTNISGFCQQINFLLSLAQPHDRLHGDALQALSNCLTLLAWQLELIDHRTGQLCLDESEQLSLIDELASALGVEDLRLTSNPPPVLAEKSISV